MKWWRPVVQKRIQGKGFQGSEKMKGMACCYPAFMAAALLVLSGAAGAVVEVKFSELDPEAAGQVVLFYRNGDSASDDARAALAAAETTVKASVGAKADDVVFKLCDAAQKDNMVGMEAKGLTALPMLFVAIEGQGTGSHPQLPLTSPRVFTQSSFSCIVLLCSHS